MHEFVTHYYPNVLEAMRTRWISPQFIATNRIDSASGYDEVKAMGRKVIELLGIETSATHMEWFFGPKGLKFSEIGCRPPGVRAWDLYNVGNDMDLYREWAMTICHGRPSQRPSRRLSAGIIALRPSQDGRISGYEGLEAIGKSFGQHIIDAHTPPPGTQHAARRGWLHGQRLAAAEARELRRAPAHVRHRRSDGESVGQLSVVPNVVLLGPQQPVPDVGAALAIAGVRGPVALVTAGWQEREADDQALIESIGDRSS